VIALVGLAGAACSSCATAITSTPYTVGPDGARFVGKVISDTGGSVDYWAQYGPTKAYGSETSHQTVEVAKNELVTVRLAIGGLERASTYHYRLCASDADQKGGPGCGEDRHFTTQSVGCGDTVTADVKLTGDLDCPQVAGLIVGADGIDIDLAGHGMFGGIAVGGGGPRAIDNTGGYDDLTIRNGSLGAWGFPIFISGASHNRVLKVNAGGAGDGITIEGGTYNEIRHSQVFGRSAGIKVSYSDGLVVADTSAQGVFGSGIVAGGDLVRIVRNESRHDGGGVGPTSGIQLAGAGGRIADNTVTGSWNVGGISVYGPDNVLLDNQVSGAAFPCCPLNSQAIGDGIFVGTGSSGSVLRRNRGDDNEGDGIQVASAGVKLEDNHGFGNGDLGIEAVAGVIDLGGNTAGGNGNPLQCLNVFCP
jgi:hypothetical protein